MKKQTYVCEAGSKAIQDGKAQLVPYLLDGKIQVCVVSNSILEKCVGIESKNEFHYKNIG